MVKILLPGSKKRHDPPEILEGQHQKRRKMDQNVRSECLKILKTLMTHKFGPVFNRPVDPVELGIPDYFIIISHPMDLGTIYKKLEESSYPFLESFADDIRLTFSNAMQYNPPNNCVHLMAKEMNELFEKSWKSVEAKSIKPIKKIVEQAKPKKNVQETSKISQSSMAKTTESKNVKKPSVNGGVKAKKVEDVKKTIIIANCEKKISISFEEKMRIKKELLGALRGDLSGPLRGFLRKYGLIYSKMEKIESAFGSFNDDTLKELKRVMKCSAGANMEKGKDDNMTNVKTQRTKETTERKKLEEKSNIESRIKAARAAKEALLESAKSDLQMKRDKEREKVEKMQRTVIIDENSTVLIELERICQSPGIQNSLEKLGLRLKEEYYYGYEYINDDDDSEELEDGEIF